MILPWLVLLPFVGGLVAWMVGKFNLLLTRWISLVVLVVELGLALSLWDTAAHHSLATAGMSGVTEWLLTFQCPWIPEWGINISFGLDGLSLLMVVLSAFLGILGVATSWTEIEKHGGFFHFNLLWIISAVIGVFLSLDLFLFFFFWEMMLIPMYLLMGIWGHENRLYASFKFFIFTQASGLLMLMAILGLTMAHKQSTGVMTFDYQQLLGTVLNPGTELWLMLGFTIAFIVKLPAFPFHTWLPDAHTEAPTAGSLILAGIMLKTGAYGLLRFVLPMFPHAVEKMAPVMMLLGVIGVIYGAVLAFAQTDLKRLVAYSSVSHMGLVLFGIFADSALALQGVVMLMIAHGLSTGGLFILAGTIQEYAHTRNMGRMGGLWTIAPRMGVIGLIFAMATLGLPGLGNFIGEFLILFGAFEKSPVITAVATLGPIVGTIYCLWMMQQVFYGTPKEGKEKLHLRDFGPRHLAMYATMVVALVWLGLFPQQVLDKATPALNAIVKLTLGGAK